MENSADHSISALRQLRSGPVDRPRLRPPRSGCIRVPRRSVYIADEYGPYVYQFDRATGRRIRNYQLPDHFAITHLSSVGATEISGNTIGRVTNKGMEGLAITPDGRTLVGLVQSPLLQDGGDGGRANRIVTIDVATGATHEYVYDNRINGKNFNSSEIIALNDHQFLIDTRDGKGLGDGSVAVVKQLFAVDIAGAVDVSTLSGEATLLTKAVPKQLFLDIVAVLFANGIATTQIPAKIEGLAFGKDVVVGGVVKHTSSWRTTMTSRDRRVDRPLVRLRLHRRGSGGARLSAAVDHRARPDLALTRHRARARRSPARRSTIRSPSGTRASSRRSTFWLRTSTARAHAHRLCRLARAARTPAVRRSASHAGRRGHGDAISRRRWAAPSRTGRSSSTTLQPPSLSTIRPRRQRRLASITAVNPAPVVNNLSVDQPTLWPPNKKMQTVKVSYDVADNCPRRFARSPSPAAGSASAGRWSTPRPSCCAPTAMATARAAPTRSASPARTAAARPRRQRLRPGPAQSVIARRSAAIEPPAPARPSAASARSG